MTFKSYKEFERALISKKVDKKLCIDFFIDMSQKKSHIAFSSTMVINLFKQKHDYIFKFLFEQGILYSAYIDQSVIQRLSKNNRQSEAFVYAVNYPTFLVLKCNNRYDKYTEEQKKTLELIKNIYKQIQYLKSDHPYSLFYFKKTLIKNNLNNNPFLKNFEYLSTEEFIEKLKFSKEHIESIKRYFFYFYSLFPNNIINAFLDFLGKHNLMSFNKIDSKLLFNKHYHKYAMNNKFDIKWFNFDSEYIEKTYLPFDTAKNIIFLLDKSLDNRFAIKNTFSNMFIYAIRNLKNKLPNYEFYKNILIYFFITHEKHTPYLFELINLYPEKNETKQIFIDLYQDESFRNIFEYYKEKINIQNESIHDFIYTYDNIANF